ncbi:MAG: hypothetical protein UT48_C0014G0004 [Parcubacteria group bacterium GW2011_GWE2_39_37]|nr:MAG: hypothetical protein UT48_C0014G0004 [Parcubacteria group bacterium GW2011_GWE2_39_37]
MLNFKKDNFSVSLFVASSLISLLLLGILFTFLRIILITPDDLGQDLNQAGPDPLITVVP